MCQVIWRAVSKWNTKLQRLTYLWQKVSGQALLSHYPLIKDYKQPSVPLLRYDMLRWTHWKSALQESQRSVRLWNTMRNLWHSDHNSSPCLASDSAHLVNYFWVVREWDSLLLGGTFWPSADVRQTSSGPQASIELLVSYPKTKEHRTYSGYDLSYGALVDPSIDFGDLPFSMCLARKLS